MQKLVLDSIPFQLPVRIRSRKASADALGLRLALTRRLSELPEVTVIESSDATVPWSMDAHLRLPALGAGEPQTGTPVCSIHEDGIGICGLSDRDRYQVLVRGWGRLTRKSVVLHLPRDVGELDICWQILQRAYRSLIQSSARSSTMRPVPRVDSLPSFSRTTLQ
jgi:hypothetical protein